MKKYIYLCIFTLLAVIITGCQQEPDEQPEPYGTPPTVSNIKFFLYKGIEFDYTEDLEITEWREGAQILGTLRIDDPDMDILTVGLSFKNIDNNKTKNGGSYSINQKENPYGMGFLIGDLAPGNWQFIVKAEDKGYNITVYEHDVVLKVNPR